VLAGDGIASTSVHCSTGHCSPQCSSHLWSIWAEIASIILNKSTHKHILLGKMNRKFSWIVLSSIVGICCSSIAVQATQLVEWRFNASRNVIGLTTDAGVKPMVFLLSNPNRLVVDLPRVSKKGRTTRTKYRGAIREIRVSQVGDRTRAVIELAAGYGISARNIKVASDSPRKWYVRLQSIERGIPPGPGETREAIKVPTSGAATVGLPPRRSNPIAPRPGSRPPTSWF
jgi:AMIN domain